MIYLDNAATTFPRPEEVLAEMDRVNRTLSVNAGRGSYKAAREAAEIIVETKGRLADLFRCKGKADIVLTPSVTYAINQIVDGLDITEETVIYTSVYEHNAVARTLERVRKSTNCQVEFLPIEPETLRIDLDRTRYQFSQKHPDIVIMTMISNVTGYRLPVEETFSMAKQYKAVTIVDAAQAAGLIDIHYDALLADIICFAGHKTLCGPFGVGGFAIRKGLFLKKLLTGGTGSNSLNTEMPENGADRYEAGSKDIVAISGLNAALSVLERKKHEEKIINLTGYLIAHLKGIQIINLCSSDDAIGIVSFTVDGYASNDVGTILDEEFDIAVRTGYHCAPYIHQYLNDQDYDGTVRVGIGPFNTEQDIDALLDALKSL